MINLPENLMDEVDSTPTALWKRGKIKMMSETVRFFYQEKGLPVPVIAYLLNLNRKGVRRIVEIFGIKRPDGFQKPCNAAYWRRPRKYRTKRRIAEQRLKTAYSPWKKENPNWKKMGYE